MMSIKKTLYKQLEKQKLFNINIKDKVKTPIFILGVLISRYLILISYRLSHIYG